jgi:hypothetical protein
MTEWGKCGGIASQEAGPPFRATTPTPRHGGYSGNIGRQMIGPAAPAKRPSPGTLCQDRPAIAMPVRLARRDQDPRPSHPVVGLTALGLDVCVDAARGSRISAARWNLTRGYGSRRTRRTPH